MRQTRSHQSDRHEPGDGGAEGGNRARRALRRQGADHRRKRRRQGARRARASTPRARARSTPFVPVNCAGMPETLLESELFGHVKGSFTGAYRDKPGKLEMADNGTIFLDEIGEMTLRMQGLLLRFLETGEMQKVGAERVGTARQRPRHRRHQPQPARPDRAGAVPRGPVLPAERHSPRGAAAARAPRGHPAADRALPRVRSVHAAATAMATARCTPHRRATIAPEAMQRCREYCLARQRPRARERHRAAGRHRPPTRSISVDDLPLEIRAAAACRHAAAQASAAGPSPTICSSSSIEERESFWTAVYPLYMNREITRGNVRDLVRKGSRRRAATTRSSLRLFNMEPRDYKRFLNFLRKHDCQLPFKEYRQ